MPSQVLRGATERGDEVDVRGVRREDEGRRRSPAAAERRARERQREQRVRDVVHFPAVSVIDVVLLYYRGCDAPLFGEP